MSWDFLIASFIADVIMHRREKKRQRESEVFSSFPTYKRASASSQRLFVQSRKKAVISEYHPLPKEKLDSPSFFRSVATVADADFERIRYYCFRLRVTPDNKDCRAELVHHLLHIWNEEANPTVLPLLQNELLYMIDYCMPTSIENRLYQHLAMFLSAQCFFFQGDFVNALKRYYQALDWQEIYQNIERDDVVTNGLEYLTEAIIANIVNIYALYGLPQKADEVCRACSAAIADTKNMHYQILSDPQGATIHGYIRQCLEVLNAREKFTGFYILDDSIYNSGNLFKESLTAVVGGEGIFSVQPSLYHIGNMAPLGEKLCFPWLTPIDNIPEIISKTLEEIKTI